MEIKENVSADVTLSREEIAILCQALNIIDEIQEKMEELNCDYLVSRSDYLEVCDLGRAVEVLTDLKRYQNWSIQKKKE